MTDNEVQAKCNACGTNWEAKRGDDLICPFCNSKEEFDWDVLPLWQNYVELDEVPRWF